MTTTPASATKFRAKSPRVVINKSRSDTQTARTEDHDYPRSRDKSWKHSLPVTLEASALATLKLTWEASDHEIPEYEGYKKQKAFLTADLDDFEIYASPKQKFGHELISLDFLDIRGKELLFDGVLSIGAVQLYVQGVTIKVYSIEGYSDDESPTAVVYIQSQKASCDLQYDIWYRLKNPSRRYRRFHRVFQWVAILGKHTIDFLETRQGGILVGLDAFRQDFYQWLIQRFPNNDELNDWLKAFGGTDFRRSIHAHIDYLGREAYNLPNSRALLKHSLWADCMREDHYRIKPQAVLCEKTVTTPHTYRCFKNRYFAEFLIETQLSDEVRDAQESRKRLLGFPCGTPPYMKTRPDVFTSRFRETPVFNIGDVIAILPDEVEERLWRKHAKDIAPKYEWFAYVQKIKTTKSGQQRLFVIWLYRPEDTPISTTDYPVTKELFLSDHCNCNEPELLANEAGRRCTIEWFSKAMDTRDDFLVRSKYVTEDSSFVSLKHDDFQCDCSKPKSASINSYVRGDTVYITKSRDGEHTLEPVVVHQIDPVQQEVIVRRLLRLKDCSIIPSNIVRQNIAENELVWTTGLFKVPCQRVQRKCYIHYFARADMASHAVPFPYNRGGAGDFWVLSSQLIMADKPCIESLQEPPAPLHQGPDFTTVPTSLNEKLRGLSLFSGCGNLDKGLEEGNVVEFKTAVEMCSEAVHTLHANARHPEDLKLWLGSVDDYLKTVLTHKDTKKLVARIGEVAVIAAGSPCPGFSTLQPDWRSEKSLRNASHVTTFCSYVDIYRPKWAFLENVVNMACVRTGFEQERVLSQIIACLVSMGYQVRQFIMSAWNYGSPQQRSRLILSIAAPGLALLDPPHYTHSHPTDICRRSIGDLLNGQKFGTQDNGPTPFPFITAEKATAHLPDIGNGNIHACIEYPDHRLPRTMSVKERTIMSYIPIDPPGMGLAEAATMGLVPQELYANKKEIGRSYRRIKKDGLFQTVVTKPSPQDARAGAVVHWSQNRPMTIEEARITQGIPPEEVIIGSTAEQTRMVGNAVDRRVSEQLGLALRRAVEQSPPEILHADEISLNRYTANPGSVERKYLVCVKVSKLAASPQAESKSFKRAQVISEESTPRKRAKAPSKWNPLVALPSDIPPSEAVDTMLGNLDAQATEHHHQPTKFPRPTPSNEPIKPSKSTTPQRPANLTSTINAVPNLARANSIYRKTRHSGLSAQFAPQSWNKVPEKEIRKAKELARRGSFPYA